MQLGWLFRGFRSGIVTTRYPREPIDLPDGFFGMPVLDERRCQAVTGCNECERACLPDAVAIRKLTDGSPTHLFTLDYGRCILCGLCVSVCPNKAMSMTTHVELSVRQSDDLIFMAELNGSGAGADAANTTAAIRDNGLESG